MVHRLVPGADVPGVDTRRHGLDALPLARQVQAGEVGAQRFSAIRVSEGQRQLPDILTKPAFAGIDRVGHASMLAWYPAEPLAFLTQSYYPLCPLIPG